MKWKFTINHIIEEHWENIQQSGQFNSFELRHLNQLRQCRTATLGGHINACDQCGHFQIAYNSCRNRHCPSCQGLKREEWIIKQEANLLYPAIYMGFYPRKKIYRNYFSTTLK